VIRTGIRATSFVVAFALSASLVWFAGDAALALAERPPSIIGQDFVDSVRAWRLQVRHGNGKRTRVALLGDSVLGAPDGERAVPDAINDALSASGARGRHVELHQLSWPGWGIAAQYFLADEIVRARPDRILLELNLRALGPAARGDLSYPELAGFVRRHRLWEAIWISLSDTGVTLEQLLFYHAIVANHLDGSWGDLRRKQADVFRQRASIETWLDESIGSTSLRDRTLAESLCLFDRVLAPGKNRERQSFLKRSLGNALGGIPATHPRMQLLKATLERFRSARIPTVVWVAPVNIEHVRSEGLGLEGLEESVATIRDLVESTGAGFVDFHALLPDSAFRDAGDHVSAVGKNNGTDALGNDLARVLLWSESLDVAAEDSLVDASGLAPR
jgi:hypothetical protein